MIIGMMIIKEYHTEEGVVGCVDLTVQHVIEAEEGNVRCTQEALALDTEETLIVERKVKN